MRYLSGFAARVCSGGCTAACIFFAGVGSGCCNAAVSMCAMSASRTSGSASMDASAASLGSDSGAAVMLGDDWSESWAGRVEAGTAVSCCADAGSDTILIVFGSCCMSGADVGVGARVFSVAAVSSGFVPDDTFSATSIVSVISVVFVIVVVSITVSAAVSGRRLDIFCWGGIVCGCAGLGKGGLVAELVFSGRNAPGDAISVRTDPTNSAITLSGGRGPSSIVVSAMSVVSGNLGLSAGTLGSSVAAVSVGLFVGAVSVAVAADTALADTAGLFVGAGAGTKSFITTGATTRGGVAMYAGAAYILAGIADAYLLYASGATGAL